MSSRLNGFFRMTKRDAMEVLRTVLVVFVSTILLFDGNFTKAEPMELLKIAPVSQFDENSSGAATTQQTAMFSNTGAISTNSSAEIAKASGVLEYAPSEDLPEQNPNFSAKDLKQIDCLARAIYFEARGEPESGQWAVAEVVANRVAAPKYPKTFCAVIHQKTGKSCQFSYVCKNKPAPVGDAWEQAQNIARQVYAGQRLNLVGDATMFHAKRVRPAWVAQFKRINTIGSHVFYSR